MKLKCKPETGFCTITTHHWNNAKKPLSSPKGAGRDSPGQNLMCFHSRRGSTAAPASALPLRRPASELRDPSAKTGSKCGVSEPCLTHAACPHTPPALPDAHQPMCAALIPKGQHTNEPHPSATGWQKVAEQKLGLRGGQSVEKLLHQTLPALPNINEPLHVQTTPRFEDGVPLLLSHTLPSYLS